MKKLKRIKYKYDNDNIEQNNTDEILENYAENKFQNKKLITFVLILMLCLGLFSIGKSIVGNFFQKNDVNENKISSGISENAIGTNHGEREGFESASELDDFLALSSWERVTDSYNKEGYIFSGPIEDDESGYGIIRHFTMKDGETYGFQFRYEVSSGKTITLQPDHTSSMRDAKCIVSTDRKTLTLDGIKFHKVERLDWVE